MKIMYFLDNGQWFGGAANTLLKQAELMKQAGEETVLVVSDDPCKEMAEEYRIICEESGMEVIRMPFRICSHTEDIDLISIMENFEQVKMQVAKYHPDILHSIQINPLAELVSRELKIPHIMNIYQGASDFFALSYTDVFPTFHLCDSLYWTKIWGKELNTDSKCVRTVAEGKRSKRKKTWNGTPVYLCVGDIGKRKNQLEVIKAFHKALDAGVLGKLILCGHDSNSYTTSCREYINKNDLEEIIIINGFCSDMEDEYAKADALICGSTRESYPNVISEALANELVVISTPVAGVPEIIKDGINGYISKGFDADSIAEKIVELNRDLDTGKLKQIRENAERTFEEYHSAVNVTRQLSEYYQYVQKEYPNKIKKLGIQEIRKQFECIVSDFQIHEKKFSRPEVVRLKLWYIYHITPVIQKLIRDGRKNIYIWGTGKNSIDVREILDFFFPDISLKGYIDTYKVGMHCGLRIYSPKSVLQEKDSVIFVGVMVGQEEVMEELQMSGKKYGKDYFLLTKRIW